MRKAIFLDRDGVINAAIIKNGKPFPPASLSELTIPADVLPALKLFKALGYFLIGASNQPDVARGITSLKAVEAINQSLCEKLPIDVMRICYHDDQDKCHCRKPLPGLLIKAAEDYKIDLHNSVMIGDRWRDIEAGKSAGCITIFINNSYDERQPDQADFTTSSLFDAAMWVKKTLNREHNYESFG